MDKQILQKQLNIGDGHPLDQIRTANPTTDDYTTYWAKQPFTVAAGKDRSLLRYIAEKFGRELADKVFNKKADREKKPIIYYLPQRLKLLNTILVEVTEPYLQVDADQRLPQGEVLKKGETALNIGRRSLLNELGIPDKPPVSSKADVAKNIISTKPEEKQPSTMEIKKEKEKLIARAKKFEIKVNKNWSLDRIKKTILEG